MDKLHEKENNYPYIIAYGESREQIAKFFISIEGHLMSVCCDQKNFEICFSFQYSSFHSQVPESYSAVETFDLFLKLHKSIGLHFDANTKTMAKFCLHFFYGIKEFDRPSAFQKNLSETMKLIQLE